MKQFGTNKDKKLTIDEFVLAYEHILKSSFSDFFISNYRCKDDNYLMKRLAPYEEQTPSNKKESSSSASRTTQA